MSYQIWEPGHLCPISILLTTSGSRGYKLLFQYPTSEQKPLTDLFETTSDTTTGLLHNKSGSCSSLEAFSRKLSEESCLRSSVNQDAVDTSIHSFKPNSYIEDDKLSSNLKEDSLVSLLAVRNHISKEKFYLKMEDVLFVGNLCGSLKFRFGVHDEAQTIQTFNVVFALRSTAPKTVQDSLYILAKSITSAICLEEKRSLFLSRERSIIQNMCDDGQYAADLLLEKSQLCRDLKQVVDDISKTGFVFSKINNMATLCHCIPQRIYHVVDNVYINSESVMYAANNVKPYHTLIFLINKEDIINSLPVYNSDFRKFLIQMCLKDTIFFASEKCHLPLSFCLKMATNLVLWGKAIISYQVLDTNVYSLAPFMDISLSPDLLDDFHHNFPSLFLPKVLQQMQCSQHHGAVVRNLAIDDDSGVQLVEWLTYNRLIYQTHKYFTLIQNDPRSCFDICKMKGFSSLKQKPLDEEMITMLTELLTDYHMIGSDEFGLDNCSDMDVIKLFSRILPLCNGEHHLEDIVFQISEPRSELVRCLDQFRKILIVVESADPVTSCFVGID